MDGWIAQEGDDDTPVICRMEPRARTVETDGRKSPRAILGEQAKIDARYIVRACNSHDALVAALRELLDACEPLDCRCSLRERDSGHLIDCPVPTIEEKREQARAALKQAEEA
jgi:hypothetical protein